jgi:hypothetical protein
MRVTATSLTVPKDTVDGLSLKTSGGEPLGNVNPGQPKVFSKKKECYHQSMLLKVNHVYHVLLILFLAFS